MRVGDTVYIRLNTKTAQSQVGAKLCDQGGSPLHFVVKQHQVGDDGTPWIKFDELPEHMWDALDFNIAFYCNRGDYFENRQDIGRFNSIQSFQQEIGIWVEAAFSGTHTASGEDVVTSEKERNYRFFEEVGELVQALKMTREEAHRIVDMVWDKPVEPNPDKEVGGVLSTLAALCNVFKFDMWTCAVNSLRSNWNRIDQIRDKNKKKQEMLKVETYAVPLVAKMYIGEQAFTPTMKLRWNRFGVLEQLHQGDPRGEFTQSKWVEVPRG